MHSSGHSSQGTTLLLGNHLVVGCGITSGHLPVCVVCSVHLDKHACHSCVIVAGCDVNTIEGYMGTMISAVQQNTSESVPNTLPSKCATWSPGPAQFSLESREVLVHNLT